MPSGNGATANNVDGCIRELAACKRWQVQQDGTLQREFTDSHTGKTFEVVAVWKLLSKSGNTLQVQQTSNNSEGATAMTVTIR